MSLTVQEQPKTQDHKAVIAECKIAGGSFSANAISSLPMGSRENRPISRKIVWAGRVISILAVLPFVLSAVMKLMVHPEVVKGMAHLGLPVSLIVPLGVLEMFCVVVYAVPWTAVLGAILFAGYVGGAILTHLRMGESISIEIILGVLIWLGIYLRDPRLRELLPFVRRSHQAI